jgi:hypothetical protein
MNLKPDPTIDELRAEYLAASQDLDTATKKAQLAMRQYENAKYRHSRARQELHDREREISSTFNPVAV